MNEVLQILKDQLKTEELIKIRSNLYRDLAEYVRSLNRVMSTTDPDITSRLAAKERQMLVQAATRLLKIRRARILERPMENILANLNGEEKYIFADIWSVKKRMKTSLEAISDGSISYFDNAAEETAAIKTMVKIVRPVPALVGVDMINYGPYQKGDVAYLPLENARVLKNQGMAEIFGFNV
jgi:DNA replication factor GINS